MEGQDAEMAREKASVIFKAQSKVAGKLKENGDGKDKCDCRPGSYRVPTPTNSTSEEPIICKNCEFGSYTLQTGATSCTSCPLVLDGSKGQYEQGQYEQCTQSTLAWGPYNIRKKVLNIHKNERTMIHLKRYIGVSVLRKPLKSCDISHEPMIKDQQAISPPQYSTIFFICCFRFVCLN